MKRAIVLLCMLLIASTAGAEWLTVCGTVCDSYGCYYTCRLVWWQYYQRIYTEPDWCKWQYRDRVYIKWNANYTQELEWYGIPADDTTSRPPADFPPTVYTVINNPHGCGISPF